MLRTLPHRAHACSYISGNFTFDHVDKGLGIASAGELVPTTQPEKPKGGRRRKSKSSGTNKKPENGKRWSVNEGEGATNDGEDGDDEDEFMKRNNLNAMTFPDGDGASCGEPVEGDSSNRKSNRKRTRSNSGIVDLTADEEDDAEMEEAIKRRIFRLPF